MAQFEPAIEVVLSPTHEGEKFSDDPDDKGGPTRYGITLQTLREVRPRATRFDVVALTRDGAREVYRAMWWDRMRLDRVEDQRVATKILDITVNCGRHGGTEIVQKALLCLGFPIKVDGAFGPITLEYVNACQPMDLLIELCAEQDHHYRMIAARDATQAKWLPGWRARARWPLAKTPEAA